MFVLSTIFLISFASDLCLVSYVSALISSAYAIIGRMVALYIFDFVSFLIDLFLQTSFKQFCCFLSLGFNLFYQISWTGNVYTPVVKFHNCSTIGSEVLILSVSEVYMKELRLQMSHFRTWHFKANSTDISLTSLCALRKLHKTRFSRFFLKHFYSCTSLI